MGTPGLRILRREVEDLMNGTHNDRQHRQRRAKTELARVDKELKQLRAQLAAERVKGDEATSYADWMSASRFGSLIQATSGSFGGVGGWWRNRAGFAL